MTTRPAPSAIEDTPARPVIGVLIALPVYYGTDILRYLHEVLQGIHAAVSEPSPEFPLGCNLLISCGMEELPLPRADKPAWPVATSGTTFLPVGPWNTDGLIVIGIRLDPALEAYLREVEAGGTPIVYAGFVGPGRSVSLDNGDGIRQALEHLHAHGHRSVAFIAGLNPPLGESGPRLEAYLETTARLGMAQDERLIANGNLLIEGGREAMAQILASGVPFTAVLACNDSSGFGAAETLRARGLRIPEDVALIGFDNLLESSAFDPPLTTVHNPTFGVGQQAVRALLERINAQGDNESKASRNQHERAPVKLVVRRSCGCRPGEEIEASSAAHCGDVAALADLFARHALLETRIADTSKLALCRAMLTALAASAQGASSANFDAALLRLLERADLVRDDLARWQRAFALVAENLAALGIDDSMQERARHLIARGMQSVREQAAQASIRALLRQENMAYALGLTSSQLLTTMNLADVPRILGEHLPQLGIPHLLAARYLPEDEDSVARAEVILRYGMEDTVGASGDRGAPLRFASRAFPPLELYPADRPWRLALLPLDAQHAGSGFVVFDAGNLEPCATIVRSLAAVMRAGALYGDALHGRQQAEEANRLKGRFLSMVSHELRTPLNLIVGLSELILRDQGAASGTPLGDDLGRIYASAQHLARLIGDVLDLASSDAGQLRLQREVLDLNEVLRLASLTGEQMAREKGLQWEVRVPPRLPQIMGDRTRLRQVLFNLISNAVKYTEQGSVALEVSVEQQDGAGRTIRVAVHDTGIGVPVSEQARIFGDFERGESARRGKSGLGLGLAICTQLVELHGGSIGVQSQGVPGRGATFFFTLPALAEDAMLAHGVAEESASSLATGTPARTILIVDDDPGILALHTRIVQELMPQARLLQARTGREAVEIMRQTRPDLVLLDLMMPDLDGFGVIEAMQAQESLRSVPVVVLTAQTLSDEEMARLNRGAASVLNKGLFSADEVRAHLESALEQRRRVSSATQRLVRQALVYMQQHSTESLTRKQIAAAVGITEDYLTECFQQEMGITPSTYLQRHRIRQAQLLLEAGELSITEVALRVGFADSTYFGRVFQREVGVTPSAYRRGVRA